MDHEAAHDLYQTLKAYDSSAKAKQGLGFTTVEHADRPAERWRSDRSAVQSSSAQAEPGTRSERWRHEAEGRDADAAHGRSESGRHRPSQRSPDRALRSSRVHSGQYRHDDKRRAGDRWLMDDERQADRRSSHSRDRDRDGDRNRDRSRDRDRDRHRDRDEDRHRDRDGDRHRDSDRHRNRDRDRDRDRDVGRRAHGSRDAESRRDGERSCRLRSRSRDPARDVAHSNRDDRPAPLHSSSRHTDYVERDQHSGHGGQRQPSPHRRQNARSAPQQKPAEGDWHKLVEGYDQMTQAMQLRARMRYQLQQATTKASDNGQQWTRFQFDSGQPPDHEEAVEFDVKELPGNAAQVDASHEAAIFGAPPKQSVTASDDDEDLPQVVELPEEANGTVDAMPTVVEEAAAPSHPKLSWRDRAAQLKAQREAQAA